MHRVTRYENGLTIATAEMPHMASVSLGIWAAVGGRFEPASLNGVSHFIEHMLFKGTRKRNSREISQAVEGIGGYLNAFTSEENTCYYSKARADRFPELLEVLTDMFLNSQFDPLEIEKERNVIKEELSMYIDQPHQHVQELLNEVMWPNQPLGRSLTGTEETVDAMTRDDMLGFRRSNYVSDGTLVTVAGNIKHRDAADSIKRLAHLFPPGRRPRFTPVRNGQTRPRLKLFTQKTEQTQMALGIPTCSRHDERRHALRLLNTILGDNMSSRLFQVLREDFGLAYSIFSSLSFFEDAGTLTISAGLDTENLPKALKLIMVELRRLTETVPGRAEFRRARDYLVGQIDLSLEGTENQMMWLGEQLLGYGSVISPTETKDRLAKVRPSEIREVAHRYFKSKYLNLALVSPLKTDRGLRRLLRI